MKKLVILFKHHGKALYKEDWIEGVCGHIVWKKRPLYVSINRWSHQKMHFFIHPKCIFFFQDSSWNHALRTQESRLAKSNSDNDKEYLGTYGTFSNSPEKYTFFLHKTVLKGNMIRAKSILFVAIYLFPTCGSCWIPPTGRGGTAYSSVHNNRPCWPLSIPNAHSAFYKQAGTTHWERRKLAG